MRKSIEIKRAKAQYLIAEQRDVFDRNPMKTLYRTQIIIDTLYVSIQIAVICLLLNAYAHFC